MDQILTLNYSDIQGILDLLSDMEIRLELLLHTNRPVLNGDIFLTDKEVSEKLKITRRTLQEYRNTGKLAYIKLGGKIIYKEADILNLLEKGYRPAFALIE